jgi:DNA polymerase-4
VLKIRRADFQTFTRRTTLDTPTDQTDAIWRTAVGLFEAWSRGETGPVRLIGMGVTQLHSRAGSQLPLFGQRTRNLDRTVDEIRERFGREAIVRGALTKQREE